MGIAANVSPRLTLHLEVTVTWEIITKLFSLPLALKAVRLASAESRSCWVQSSVRVSHCLHFLSCLAL